MVSTLFILCLLIIINSYLPSLILFLPPQTNNLSTRALTILYPILDKQNKERREVGEKGWVGRWVLRSVVGGRDGTESERNFRGEGEDVQRVNKWLNEQHIFLNRGWQGVVYHYKDGGVSSIESFPCGIMILCILTISIFFSGYALFVG